MRQLRAKTAVAMDSLLRGEPVLAAIVLLTGLACLAGWEVLCLGEVARAERVRLLPRRAWALAGLMLIPAGGILYLLAGRVWHRGAARS
jgi:hypothetical protein